MAGVAEANREQLACGRFDSEDRHVEVHRAAQLAVRAQLHHLALPVVAPIERESRGARALPQPTRLETTESLADEHDDLLVQRL